MIVPTTLKTKPPLPIFVPVYGSTFRIISTPYRYYVHELNWNHTVVIGCDIKCGYCNEQQPYKRYVTIIKDRVDNQQKYFELCGRDYYYFSDNYKKYKSLNLDFTVRLFPHKNEMLFMPIFESNQEEQQADLNLLNEFANSIMKYSDLEKMNDIAEIIT